MIKEEAIEILSDMRAEYNIFSDDEEATRYHALSWAIQALNEQQRTGRWERHYYRPNVYADLYWHCSECGYKNDDQYANVYHKFCPNCGARMEMEE